MLRKVLIVDDNVINRELLKNTLRRDYDILEAADGREALALMHRNYKVLSAVLLDIVMPVMDGYEVLESVRDNMQLAQIPVIMVTSAEDEDSRVRALSLGANDFIQKPFNPDIVRHCLKNNIALRETASILNAIQKDKLTGLFNREAFFDRVSSLIGEHEPGYYTLSSFDIDNFKLINDQYGAVEGDRILREVGKTVLSGMEDVGGIAGRISADNFAALFPSTAQGTGILQRIKDDELNFTEQQMLVFSVGRYVITDLSLPASAIYDRAYIAKQSVKRRYDQHMAYFDSAMLEKLVRDQQITGEMEGALAAGQFEVWFQPQYDHATGALIGAEALARWRHPQKGIVAPNEFIPLFEQNGFVYELDKYMWREVCRCQRKWLDAGYKPLPVSVNISRCDIFRADLIEVITGLVSEYALPMELLCLEITESAFSESTERIVSIVKQFIALGFTVEIDDFGSGYSSLNTLKDVPAQILKMDMYFLREQGDSRRGGSILQSIVRMAKWLGMTVLAEGVEEKAQADFLQSIGCTYVQGYLYARPMPEADYEELFCCGDLKRQPLKTSARDLAATEDFWDPMSVDSLVFNRYVGGACVYEYHEGSIELIRMTDKYVRMVFGSEASADELMELDWMQHVSPEMAEHICAAMDKSVETNDEVSGEFLFLDLPGCPHETFLRTFLRVIASVGDRQLVYCISENITAQRQAEKKEREAEKKRLVAAEQLKLLINSIQGGIATYEGCSGDPSHHLRLTYFSDGLCHLFGYTREEYTQLAAVNPASLVFAEDAERMTSLIGALVETGKPMDCIYRTHIKNGGYKWIQLKAALSARRGKTASAYAVFFDVTAQQETIERLRMSEEEKRLAIRHSRNVVCRYDVETRQLTVSPNVNPAFGLSDQIEDVPYGQVRTGQISPETAATYTAFYEAILRGEKEGELVYQRLSDNGWRWVEAHSSTIFSADGKPVSAVISFVDISDRLMQEAVYKKWQQSIQERRPEAYSLFRCNVSKHTSFSMEEGALLNVRFEKGPADFDDYTAAYVKQCVFPEDVQRFAAFLNVDALLKSYYRGKRILKLEYREKLPEAGQRWLRLTVDLVETPHTADVEAYLLFEDIDAAKREEFAMLERAQNDPLTGVLNRATFIEKVNERISSSAEGRKHALLMLDIDGFKFVNDVFGHAAGDQALIDVADTLRKTVRGGDLIGRLGGDEFVVFLSDIPGEAVAANKARQICELTRKFFSQEVRISGSVGIALAPRDGTDFETLYKKADVTLYYIKGLGKDNFAFYHAEMVEDRTQAERDDEAAKERTPYRKARRRMLIVDDNQLDYELLANMFKDEFVIDKAQDGHSALIRMRHYGTAISAVLLDLVMPGMDGFQMLEKMQQSTELRSIPVIVVSGESDRETSLKAIRAGASDFVMKPVDAQVLRIRVQSAVSKAENERLRAKNSYLELQNSEMLGYRTVLERSGTVVVEHDWGKGSFQYSPGVSMQLAGTYDERGLWRILLSDMVTDAQTVKQMQQLVHDIADERGRMDGDLSVQLKTASGRKKTFLMHVYKIANEFGLTDKLILTFRESGQDA